MKKDKMIFRNRFVLGFFVLLMTMKIASGQQDPMYTQYMFNTQTINPAYVGTWQSVGFLALSRMQWVGIEGAPSTQTFSFQMPLRNKDVGIGLNVINDKIGLEQKLSVFADYSYKLKLGPVTNLRMGIKGGFSNYSHNLSSHVLYPDGVSDPLFQGEIEHNFLPNAGVGLFLDDPRYYVGISLPKVVNSKYQSNSNDLTVNGEIRHFFFIAGYVRELSEDLVFKPTILLKATIGSPIQADFSANFLLKDKVWLGAMYRTGDSYGFVAQWIFDNNLRLGYAIDFTTSNLRHHHYNTHEIMLSYELKIVKQRVISPRYF